MAETNALDYSTISQNSYAAFDAISLRNLIIERLNAQGVFTDQNYLGSNLASIIDIISYAFNALMFYLNRTSTESMFTEAQLYENMNRIVKLLDYKPVGYQTSTLPFNVYVNPTNLSTLGTFFLIPRYSYLMVGGIPFCFNEDITFSLNAAQQLNADNPQLIELADISNNQLLYQGVFRENEMYTAIGDKNEVVVLNLSNLAVDHFNVHVYVWEATTEKWYQYEETNSLYIQTSFDKTFEKRLNSDRRYEIAFGDDINGRQLKAGDKVMIYYLQSFGEKGIIGANVLEDSENRGTLTKTVYDSVIYREIFEDTRQDTSSIVMTSTMLGRLLFRNSAGSTLPQNIESAESMRKNAPSNFKSQYRLVTEQDFETFVKVNFDNFISDIRVFNNWDYTSKYLKYFNDLKINATTFQQLVLNQTLYADACNFNNVYICATPKAALGSSLKYLLPAQKELIRTQVEPLKMLTTEVTFLDPIFKAVALGFKTQRDIVLSSEFTNDLDLFQLVVTKESTSNRTSQSIISDIVTIMQNYFNPTALKLGQTFNYTTLVDQILGVNGVENIKTYLAIEGETSDIESFDGLSFIMFNPTFPDLDKKFINNNITLNPFEFLYYANFSVLSNQIVVV